jgi:hypothetical protein
MDELTIGEEHLYTQLSMAWEIIDDFALILHLAELTNDSKFFTIYKRAMEWLREYEQ